MMIRSGLAATLIVFASCAYAEVNCSCPVIAADGEGNTSCSTAESNDRCTVDFNEFGERERRAALMLSELGIDTSFLPSQSFDDILRNDPSSGVIYSLVLTYLSVAAVDQMISHPESISAQQIGELIEYAKENYSDQINAAFVEQFHLYDPLAPAPDQIPVLFADSNIVVTPGCVEIRVGELWVMYKAFWSPARASPQCGGSGLAP